MENKNPQTGKGTGGDFSFESIVAKPLSAKASENAQQTQHSAKASNANAASNARKEPASIFPAARAGAARNVQTARQANNASASRAQAGRTQSVRTRPSGVQTARTQSVRAQGNVQRARTAGAGRTPGSARVNPQGSVRAASVSRSSSGEPPRRGHRKSIPRARRMKLSVTRVDPWSISKITFILGIALIVIQDICASILWILFKSIGLFNTVSDLMSSTGLESDGGAESLMSFGKVISFVTIFSVFEVIVFVLLATVATFLYNISASLIGGIHVTLGDD